MKHFVPVTIAMILVILFGESTFFWQDKFQTPLVPRPGLGNDADSITLLFAGDIMLDRGVEYYIQKNGGDWRFPFLNIADFLQKADLVFGNLESVISDKGEKQGSIYSFRADPRTLEGLSFAGFDVLSVANNHSLDYGSEALVDSIQRLKDAGIIPVGGGSTNKEAYAPALKYFYTSKYSSVTTISILAYTAVGSSLWEASENTPGIAWVDEHNLAEFTQRIKDAKKEVDILVLSIHFGEEYQTQPNDMQQLIAKSAVIAGADIVIGHHPHVIQLIEPEGSSDVRPEGTQSPREPERPVERYKEGWIAYSLGNFIFDQGFSKETTEGLLLEVTIHNKKITRVSPRPIHLNSLFQPRLAE